MIWRYVFAGLGLVFAVFLVVAGLYIHFNPPPRIPRTAFARPTLIPPAGAQSTTTLEQRVPYPANWPADLRYPADLGLVTASARPAERGTEWTAVLDYRGTAQDATDLLDQYFAARGWRVARSGVPPNEPILEIAKDGVGSGFIRIEADADREETRVVAAIILSQR